MQIEVTEKEARGIYSQRYLAKSSKFKYFYLPLLIVGIAFIVSLFSMQYIGDWLGLLLFIIMISPPAYLYIRISRSTRKYARKQIEEQV